MKWKEFETLTNRPICGALRGREKDKKVIIDNHIEKLILGLVERKRGSRNESRN